MKSIIPIATSLLLIGTAAAFAGQPERPGALGRDRAEGVQSFQKGGANDTGAPGASEWGHTAAERGSTNGDVNRQYKEDNAGAPTKGNAND
jgi:hypothetical protein